MVSGPREEYAYEKKRASQAGCHKRTYGDHKDVGYGISHPEGILGKASADDNRNDQNGR